MAELIPWILLLLLAAAGIVAVAHRRPMTDAEYEERLGKGNALGNALQEVQGILDPGAGENLRRAKTELRAEADPSGDPPEPRSD